MRKTDSGSGRCRDRMGGVSKSVGSGGVDSGGAKMRGRAGSGLWRMNHTAVPVERDETAPHMAVGRLVILA